MSPTVNPPRKYDASRRQEQARETRRAVLAAAHAMFVEQGYAQTTMAGVAEAAGVSVETVYKAFGNKAKLVKACFDVAVVGDDEPVALMERDDGIVAQTQAETDPRTKLSLFGAHIADTSERTGPIQLAVKAAAATDAAAAEVWAELGRERLIGMTGFALHLKETKSLRKGVTLDEARDVLWTFLGIEWWEALVLERGWDSKRFGKWISQQLIAALL